MATGVNDHAHSNLSQQQVICEDTNHGGKKKTFLNFKKVIHQNNNNRKAND